MNSPYLIIVGDTVENSFASKDAALAAAERYAREESEHRERTVARVQFQVRVELKISTETV